MNGPMDTAINPKMNILAPKVKHFPYEVITLINNNKILAAIYVLEYVQYIKNMHKTS